MNHVAGNRFARLLVPIASGFALLGALQTLDSFAQGWSSMADAQGAVATALVLFGIAAGSVGGVLPRSARSLFLAALVLYVAGLLLWPFSIQHTIPSQPIPWFGAMWPSFAAYLVIFRRVGPPVAVSVLVTVYIAVVLAVRGGVHPADAVTTALTDLMLSLALIFVVTAIRRSLARADRGTESALRQYAAASYDQAAESERRRTDALVHDSVLTTFLSAAAAQEADVRVLARRMAMNALRTLDHVNRTGPRAAGMPFGKAMDASAALQPLLSHFDVKADRALPVPVDVAEVLIEATVQVMTEALQHTRMPGIRSLQLTEFGPDGVRIVVSDDSAEPWASEELKSRIAGQLRPLDGRAEFTTSAEGGSVVILSWGSIVISGTTPMTGADSEVAT